MGTLHFVYIDTLRDLPYSDCGNQYNFIKTGQYPKLRKAILIARTTVTRTTSMIVNHYVVNVGALSTVLMDNGPPFTPKLITVLYETLAIKKNKTTGYHPPSTGNMECFNATMIMRYQHYAAEYQNIGIFLFALMHAYNIKVHQATALPLFRPEII